jgi:hypothetical protein
MTIPKAIAPHQRWVWLKGDMLILLAGAELHHR